MQRGGMIITSAKCRKCRYSATSSSIAFLNGVKSAIHVVAINFASLHLGVRVNIFLAALMKERTYMELAIRNSWEWDAKKI